MAEGFVIFRDPESQEIKGLKGVFGQHSELESCQFLIQPWSLGKVTEYLSAKEWTNDTKMLASWADTIRWGVPDEPKQMDEKEFGSYIQKVKQSIHSGKLKKAVTARCKVVPLQNVRPFEAFQKACTLYPTAFCFLLNHPVFGTWLGATPEIFIHSDGHTAKTVALAGTLKTGDYGWTGKEREEQGVIGEYIEEVLAKEGLDFQKKDVETAQAGPLQHLMTKYTFKLENGNISAFMQELHPTPAVGGYPKNEALALIDKEEDLDRNLYSGWLGYKQGSELYTWVNLRCARLFQDRAHLYAGCGINKDSVAEKEWEETEAKMQVIMACL